MQPNDPMNQNQAPVSVVVEPTQPAEIPTAAPVVPADAVQALGQPVAPSIAVQPMAEAPVAARAANPLLRAGVTLALLAVVGVGGFFGWNTYSKHQADATAKAFISAVNAGDSNKAFALSSANLQKQNDPLQFADTMDGLQTKSPKFAQAGVSVAGGKADYVAQETNLPADDSGSTEATFSLALVRSGLGWKVDGVNVE